MRRRTAGGWGAAEGGCRVSGLQGAGEERGEQKDESSFQTGKPHPGSLRSCPPEDLSCLIKWHLLKQLREEPGCCRDFRHSGHAVWG